MGKNWRKMVETDQERRHRECDENLSLLERDHPQVDGVAYIADEAFWITGVDGKAQYLTCGTEVRVARGERETVIGEARQFTATILTTDFDAIVESGRLSAY